MNIKKLKKEVIKTQYILGFGNISPLYYCPDSRYDICGVTSDIDKTIVFKSLYEAKKFLIKLNSPCWKILKI